MAVIGKSDDLRRQRVHIRERFPLFSDRNGPVGKDPDDGVLPDEIQLNTKVFQTVRAGIQVRHRADGRITAAGRSQRAAGKGLLIRKSRLTEVHVHVGEAGKNGERFTGNDLIVRRSGAAETENTVKNGNILSSDIAVTVYVDVGKQGTDGGLLS